MMLMLTVDDDDEASVDRVRSVVINAIAACNVLQDNCNACLPVGEY